MSSHFSIVNSQLLKPPAHLQIDVGLRTVIDLLQGSGDVGAIEIIGGADFGNDE